MEFYQDCMEGVVKSLRCSAAKHPLRNEKYVVGQCHAAIGSHFGAMNIFFNVLYHFSQDIRIRCKEKLDNLAISVMNQWPSVRLRVTEGFDEDGYHATESLHYSGRAVDITTSDRDTSKYGMLARLAVEAGFDWVYFESRSHIHCSVKKESTMPNKNIGCFKATSTVMTKVGYKKMADLKIGDEVVSKFEVNGVLSFSKVIAFLHRDKHMNVTFVRIQTNSSNILLLTQRHLIFKWKNEIPTATYAMHVKEGDFIYTRSVTNQTMLATVTNVSLLTLKGVYAPLTESGTIVVDGIWVSCYAEVTSHNMAHALFFPDELEFKRGTIDMLIVFGDTDCNGPASSRLYQETYPNRCVPHHTTFTIEGIIARISTSDVPGISQTVRISVQRHFQDGQTTSGCKFEHLL
ncbi:desert hedgehog protein B [Trichonephila clavipes]|nr:desert hedgehog protein B [Trichonephila clavipes]